VTTCNALMLLYVDSSTGTVAVPHYTMDRRPGAEPARFDISPDFVAVRRYKCFSNIRGGSNKFPLGDATLVGRLP